MASAQRSAYPVLLQTGTGTVDTAAISIVAITAVIFSLAARLILSSEYEANFSSAALYAASRGYAVTAITL